MGTALIKVILGTEQRVVHFHHSTVLAKPDAHHAERQHEVQQSCKKHNHPAAANVQSYLIKLLQGQNHVA